MYYITLMTTQTEINFAPETPANYASLVHDPAALRAARKAAKAARKITLVARDAAYEVYNASERSGADSTAYNVFCTADADARWAETCLKTPTKKQRETLARLVADGGAIVCTSEGNSRPGYHIVTLGSLADRGLLTCELRKTQLGNVVTYTVV